MVSNNLLILSAGVMPGVEGAVSNDRLAGVGIWLWNARGADAARTCAVLVVVAVTGVDVAAGLS